MDKSTKKFEKELGDINSTGTRYTLIKDLYTAEREKQRNIIKSYLTKEGFANKGRGMGKKDYTDSHKLKVPFDLRTYKFITVTKDEYEVFISLQPPEQDSYSKNRHTLIDRLGVRVYPKSQTMREQAEKDFSEIKLTEIDLPLTREKLAELLDFINKEIELIKKDT